MSLLDWTPLLSPHRRVLKTNQAPLVSVDVESSSLYVMQLYSSITDLQATNQTFSFLAVVKQQC